MAYDKHRHSISHLSYLCVGDSCSITEEEEALSAGIPAASAEHKRKKLKAYVAFHSGGDLFTNIGPAL